MMTRQGKLTVSDLGCYADGANGLGHQVLTLRDLLREYEGPAELTEALDCDSLNYLSDDLSELDEALDWLNDNVCDYPAQFIFSNGDLMLVNIETWEE